MNDDLTFVLRRARLRRALIPALMLVAGAFVTALAVETIGDPISDAVSGEAKIGGAIAVLMVVAGLWMLWRALTVRVVISRSEVILRNMGATKRVPLSEIAGFEVFRTNEFGRPRTVLRLRPGRHGIPRSLSVAGTSTETLTGAWLALISGMHGAYRTGNPIVDFTRNRRAKVPRAVGDVIAEMNAALDARRGSGEQTADLLAAAHPKFRTILDDDD